MDMDKLYFMDPSLPSAYGYLAHQEFLDRWHDYETRHGEKIRTNHLALFVHGKKALNQYPAPLKKIE